MMRHPILCLALGAACLPADHAGAAAELSSISDSAQRAMRPLQAEELLAAMYKALDTREAKIEIVEFSRFLAPEGALEFAWKDLTPPVSVRTPTRWRGYVRYDGDRRFAVWAMVRVTAQCRRVVATKPLRSEEPIRPDQIRVEAHKDFPSAKNFAPDVADVVGRVSIRPVAVNGVITAEMLREEAIVSKGGTITAEYKLAGVRLSLPVIAERAARAGEVIPVRNPASRKTFLARVNEEGIAVVEAGRPGVYAGSPVRKQP